MVIPLLLSVILVFHDVPSVLSSVYQHRLLPKANECGVDKMGTDKIISGQEVGLREFPWVALLFYTDDDSTDQYSACGGSLISKRYVLTAAQCVNKLHFRELVKVRLGEYNTATDIDCQGEKGFEVCNPAVMDYGIESVVVHADYHRRRKFNDIALIRLDQDVVFAEHIQPLCLPEETAPTQTGTNVTVAGWGETENGTISQVKLKDYKIVISQSECTNLFNNLKLVDMQFCAKQICEDDTTCRAGAYGSNSGSPSVRTIPQTSQWVQEGIISFVSIISEVEVHTEVSKYVKWIVDNMKD